MLCQFSFQNFKSYKGETTLDFQAATLPEFKETLITEEKAADLLPVSVIYGPNGGGKSNLLQAISCVISTIVKPVNELGKNRQNLILQQKVDAMPFLFDQTSANEPTDDRIKSTAAYDKQYLEGRYGADPYLSNMLGGGF